MAPEQGGVVIGGHQRDLRRHLDAAFEQKLRTPFNPGFSSAISAVGGVRRNRLASMVCSPSGVSSQSGILQGLAAMLRAARVSRKTCSITHRVGFRRLFRAMNTMRGCPSSTSRFVKCIKEAILSSPVRVMVNTCSDTPLAGYTARNRLDTATLDRFAIIELKCDAGR